MLRLPHGCNSVEPSLSLFVSRRLAALTANHIHTTTFTVVSFEFLNTQNDKLPFESTPRRCCVSTIINSEFSVHSPHAPCHSNRCSQRRGTLCPRSLSVLSAVVGGRPCSVLVNEQALCSFRSCFFGGEE